MKTSVLMVAVVLLSVTVILFGVMYDLIFVEDKELRTSSLNPDFSSFGENAYALWSESKESRFSDVYLRKITDGNLIDDPINLTNGDSFYPKSHVLASENSVYVLWEDRTDKHGHDGDTVYFKKSNNYGNVFDETMVFGSSHIDRISHTPISMKQVNGILYVFMFQWDPHTDEKTVVFRSSHDGGGTFGKPVPFFEFDKKWASLFDTASVNGTIYAVSADEHGHSDKSGKILFKKILPDGKASDVVHLNKTGHFVNSLDIVVSDNNVYVISVEVPGERNDSDGIVREKRTLYLTKSDDGGNTFEKSKKLNVDSESEGVKPQGVSIFAYDDFVFVMWEERYYDNKRQDWQRKTWHANSGDGGQTFEVVAVHPLDELREKYGHIDAYEENKILYFIVTSKTNSFDEDSKLYFAKSDDGGITTPRVIDVVGHPVQIPYKPKVSIDDNYIHIITDVTQERNCILYVSSNDAGESFFEPLNLSPNGSLEDCFVR